MYLMIENCGEAPVESFTVFGASTSRGDNSKIGQFGSGAKFGTLVCMRFGINPVVYCGTDKLEFYSKPMQMSGNTFSRVCYKHKNKRVETSYTLEFGELDWDNCNMGLREYISNALDASDSKYDVSIKIVDSTRAASGKTRVFVPLTADVQNYYNTLHEHFLHFNENSDDEKAYGVLNKRSPGRSRIYRLGVFVSESCGSFHSLFDYNFDNSVRIDECRNMNDFTISYHVAKCLRGCTHDQFLKLVDSLTKGEKNFETNLGGHYTRYNFGENWADWFHDHYGDNAVLVTESTKMIANKAANKGFKIIIIENEEWCNTLASSGIKTVVDVMDDVNNKGHELYEASPVTISTAGRVWGWLETMGVTKGKKMPVIKEFVNLMDGGEYCGGYVLDDIVHIEREQRHSTKVMLEEFAHYITGSSDNSRDFQDFAFKVAALMGEVMA